MGEQGRRRRTAPAPLRRSRAGRRGRSRSRARPPGPRAGTRRRAPTRRDLRRRARRAASRRVVLDVVGRPRAEAGARGPATTLTSSTRIEPMASRLLELEDRADRPSGHRDHGPIGPPVERPRPAEDRRRPVPGRRPAGPSSSRKIRLATAPPAPRRPSRPGRDGQLQAREGLDRRPPGRARPASPTLVSSRADGDRWPGKTRRARLLDDPAGRDRGRPARSRR